MSTEIHKVFYDTLRRWQAEQEKALNTFASDLEQVRTVSGEAFSQLSRRLDVVTQQHQLLMQRLDDMTQQQQSLAHTLERLNALLGG